MAEGKLSPEVSLIAALDSHVQRQGPKSGAELMDAVAEAVEVILQKKIEPETVRRAVGFVRDRAEERARAAIATYEARRAEKATTPPEAQPVPEAVPEAVDDVERPAPPVAEEPTP